MIRHYDGTADCAQKLSAQSKRGAIWAACWTLRKHRVCLTRQEADRLFQVWKKWYERQGWKIVSYRAHKDGETHAFVIHKYDARTRERIA